MEPSVGQERVTCLAVAKLPGGGEKTGAATRPAPITYSADEASLPSHPARNAFAVSVLDLSIRMGALAMGESWET
jgi:hypothetical protein